MQLRVILASGAEEVFTGYLVDFEVEESGSMTVSVEDQTGREINNACYAHGVWSRTRLTVPMTPAQARLLRAMDMEEG